MAKSYNQKVKLLYLMDLLLEKTDEEHTLSMKEILEAMEKEGIRAARKSIYHDLDTLRQYGMDIEYRKEPPEGYYLASHTFELAELKLLVDAVQSSRFITERKSRSLIRKLEELSSIHQASSLQRQVYVADRVKTMNESIYYNVDKLYEAIARDSQITFQYNRWIIEKKAEIKSNGKHYRISPWALSWQDENYYLIGYEEDSGILKHFRVDKMQRIELLKERRLGKARFQNFDPAVYSKKTFGMFAGEEEQISLRLPNRMVGVIMDRFGKNTSIRKDGEDYFIARIQVAVSEQFFGWLTGLGKDVIIVSPKKVAEQYRALLEEIIYSYDN